MSVPALCSLRWCPWSVVAALSLACALGDPPQEHPGSAPSQTDFSCQKVGCHCEVDEDCRSGLYCNAGRCGYSGHSDEECIAFDRVGLEVVPPAGVRIRFRALGCDATALGELGDEHVTVINDEKGEAFDRGGEGASASPLASQGDIDQFSLLLLDMSQSIVDDPDRLAAMLDGASRFVDTVMRDAEPELRHQVAIVAFGSTAETGLVQDFSGDADELSAAIDALREAPSRGSTNLYGAYRTGLELIAQPVSSAQVVERFVVMFTDGTHEAGDEERLREAALVARDETDAVVYSLDLRGDHDSTRLAELATHPSQYFDIAEVGAVATRFEDISANALALARSNYVIGICTPVELGSPTLTVDIQVDARAGALTLPYDTAQLTGAVQDCDARQVAGVAPE